MVGVPGKAGACVTCRRRKKGCDKQEPFCQQCISAGLVCEGYKQLHIWVNSTGKERATYTQAHNTVRAPAEPGSITLYDSLVRSARDTKYIGLFLSGYLPNGRMLSTAATQLSPAGWLRYHEYLSRSEKSLQLITLAHGLATLAERENNEQLRSKGIEAYRAGLRETVVALRDPKRATGDGMLAAVRLYRFYEIRYGAKGAGAPGPKQQVDSYKAHSDGERAMFKAKGPCGYWGGPAQHLLADGRVVSIPGLLEDLDKLRELNQRILENPEARDKLWKDTMGDAFHVLDSSVVRHEELPVVQSDEDVALLHMCLLYWSSCIVLYTTMHFAGLQPGLPTYLAREVQVPFTCLGVDQYDLIASQDINVVGHLRKHSASRPPRIFSLLPTTILSSPMVTKESMHTVFDDKSHITRPEPQRYTYAPIVENATAGNTVKKTTWGHMRPWIEEIIWCALALGFFAALVAVLSHFDKHPLPDWPLGLSVNTLIALLSTICRAMILVPIERDYLSSNGIASRGPWGAICLVPKTRGGFLSFSTVAALVWATGIATSFVTQSTITFQDENVLVPNANASVHMARSFPQSLLDSGFENQDVIEGVTRGAYQAAFYAVNQTLPHVAPTCSTSRCEWPPVSSLGLCASVKNVTEYLEVSGPKEGTNGIRLYNASLPEGLGFLNFTDKFHVMANVSSPLRQQSEDDDDEVGVPKRRTLSDWDADIEATTIAHFFIIHSNASPNMKTRFRAVELLWHFCVRTYAIEVTNGTDETTISASSIKINSSDSNLNGENEWNSFILSDKNGEGSFNVTTSSIHVEIDENFRRAFSGDWSNDPDDRLSSPLTYQLGYNLMSGVAGTTPDEEFDSRTWKNLQTYTNHIAEGMTAFLRTADAQGSVEGKSYNRETYMFVRWQWLALLASQVGLTVVFLVAIIIHTARIGVEVVKSSNAAELFALQEDGSQGTRMMEKSHSGINTKVGKASQGMLINTGGGWKLQI
ncbi:hypothetical protein FSARC_13601 [Fusarium sarcochroum]|uniref:Zn(2)-C6 fungal-type domain-containing protein n=1 Tax=Fusarium sarcochroum TaxID=1208366 RepID=A0A8H4WSV9_9HYPO|nr:hypothetical protein FSARC_13601 [Fusarium sarcochroum]